MRTLKISIVAATAACLALSGVVAAAQEKMIAGSCSPAVE
jgi:hypothetical protein